MNFLHVIFFAISAWYCLESIRSGKAAVYWGPATPYIYMSRRPWLFWTMVVLAGAFPFICLIIFKVPWM